MKKRAFRDLGLMPLDHPMLQQGVSLVGVPRFGPSMKNTLDSMAGAPQTPTTSAPQGSPSVEQPDPMRPLIDRAEDSLRLEAEKRGIRARTPSASTGSTTEEPPTRAPEGQHKP